MDIGIFPTWNQFQFQLFLFHNPIHFIAKKTLTCVLCISKSFLRKTTICIDASDTDTSGVCILTGTSCIKVLSPKCHFFSVHCKNTRDKYPKNENLRKPIGRISPKKNYYPLLPQQIFLSNFTDISYISSKPGIYPKWVFNNFPFKWTSALLASIKTKSYFLIRTSEGMNNFFLYQDMPRLYPRLLVNHISGIPSMGANLQLPNQNHSNPYWKNVHHSLLLYFHGSVIKFQAHIQHIHPQKNNNQPANLLYHHFK